MMHIKIIKAAILACAALFSPQIPAQPQSIDPQTKSPASKNASTKIKEGKRGFLLLGLEPGQSTEYVAKTLERNYGMKIEYPRGASRIDVNFSKYHAEFEARVELYFSNGQLASGYVKFLNDNSAVNVVMRRNFGANLPELLKTQRGSYLESIYCVTTAASFIVGTTARGTNIVEMKTPSDPAAFMRPRGSSYMPVRNGCDSAASDGFDQTVILYPASAEQKLAATREFDKLYGNPLSVRDQQCLSFTFQDVSSGNQCELRDYWTNECTRYSTESYWTNIIIRNSCTSPLQVNAICPSIEFQKEVKIWPKEVASVQLPNSIFEGMFGKGHKSNRVLESCELRQPVRRN